MAIYFVTTQGNSTNTGLSEGASWNLTKGLSTVQAGDTLYIKAGDYIVTSSLFITNNGASGNPIKIIGYKNNPLDIQTNNSGSTVTYQDYLNNNEDLDPTDMPLIRRPSIALVTNTGDEGLSLSNKSYIELENLQFKWIPGIAVEGYSHGSSIKLKNIIAAWCGNFDPVDSWEPGIGNVWDPPVPPQATGSISTNLSGGAISLSWNASGTGPIVEDCLGINNGHYGIQIDNTYTGTSQLGGVVRRCNVYCNQNINPTDYYIELIGNGTLVEDCGVYRKGILTHQGHGIDFKYSADYNVVRNCYIENTWLEFNGNNDYNLIENVVIKSLPGTYAYNTTLGGIQFISGGSNNTLKNITMIDTHGIYFTSFPDGASSAVPAGTNNIFINLLAYNQQPKTNYGTHNAFIAWSDTNISGQWTTQPASNNKWYNCTFDTGNAIIHSQRPNSGNEFINCSFSNITSYLETTNGGVTYADNSIFTKCNFYNCPVPSGSGQTVVNATTGNPLFVNRTARNYKVQLGSALINTGIVTPYAYDIEGQTRPQDSVFDIGAYEYKQAYYVTPTGNSSNNGLSENTAWSLTYAATQVKAGETVYVKAGLYDNVQLTLSVSGTENAPIKFIGYTNTPGDIVATNGPTYTYEQFKANNPGKIETKHNWSDPDPDRWQLPNNVMPHLKNNITTLNSFGFFAPEPNDVGITITGNYVEVHNFMISFYEDGIRLSANNYDPVVNYITLDNIIINEGGWFDPNLPGWNENAQSAASNPPNDQLRRGSAIKTNSKLQFTYSPVPTSTTRYTGHVWKNCMIVDGALALFFMIDLWQSTIENNYLYARQPGNGPDYMFDGFGMQDCVLRNNYAYRIYRRNVDSNGRAAGHFTRGFILQAMSDRNLIDGFISINANTQVENGADNIIKNVRSIGDTDANAENDGQLQVICGLRNKFINCEYSGGGPFISLLSRGINERSSDRNAIEGYTVNECADNYFINFVGYNGASIPCVVSLHRFSETTNSAIHKNNYVINSTFYNFGAIWNANKRINKLWFYNTSFNNSTYPTIDRVVVDSQGTWQDWRASVNAGTDVIFTNCHFNGNSFITPTGTNSQIDNPFFVSVSTNNFNISSVSSPLVGNGMDSSTLVPEAAYDFNNNLRIIPYDIGAYEFAGTPPPTDIINPVITLSGNFYSIINIGQSFVEPGYTAIDNADGNITNNVIVDNTIDNQIPGTYVITYNVSDSFGNQAIEKARYVTVVRPKIGVYLKGGSQGINPAPVAYIGSNKLKG